MTKKYKVEGYTGWSDYDGPEDYNHHFEIEVDNVFTKEDILAALYHHYSNSRTKVFKITEI